MCERCDGYEEYNIDNEADDELVEWRPRVIDPLTAIVQSYVLAQLIRDMASYHFEPLTREE